MSQTKRSRKSRDFSTVNPAAAAIDIGATIHVAAVGPNRDKEPVHTFRTFTDDLYRLADWFAGVGSGPWSWSQPAFTGFRCSRSWNSAASR